jgi:hypothetical protein
MFSRFITHMGIKFGDSDTDAIAHGIPQLRDKLFEVSLVLKSVFNPSHLALLYRVFLKRISSANSQA